MYVGVIAIIGKRLFPSILDAGHLCIDTYYYYLFFKDTDVAKSNWGQCECRRGH